MKNVFKSDEIPHLWFHQTQESARDSGERISFNGPTLRSYRLTIGRLVTNNKGEKAVLVNNTSHSHTTAKHQSMMMRAIPSYAKAVEVLEIPDNFYDHAGTGTKVFNRLVHYVASLQKSIDELPALEAKAKETRAAFRAGTGSKGAANYATKDAACARKEYPAEVAKWTESALFINEFFGLGRSADIKEEAAEQARAAEAARIEQARKAAIAAEEEKVKQQEDLQTWLAGLPLDRYISFATTAFRVVDKTSNTHTTDLDNVPHYEVSRVVESTRGVFVPLADAVKAWHFIQSKRATGWHRNGEQFPIGGYQLDRVTPEGFVAGCHVVDWKEFDRFGDVLGLTP